MRPPEFTGGNRQGRQRAAGGGGRASMRPPEFTGGNFDDVPDSIGAETCFNEAAGIHRRKPHRTQQRPPTPTAAVASMRPPEFTGGNSLPRDRMAATEGAASMRPPEFTGGNQTRRRAYHGQSHRASMMAAGIHRRKPGHKCLSGSPERVASMRPPEFTGGNDQLLRGHALLLGAASMRPPEFTGGNTSFASWRHTAGQDASMRPPEFTGGNAATPVGSMLRYQLQ